MITINHKTLRYLETASKPFSSFSFFILFAALTSPYLLDKFAMIKLYSSYSVAFFTGSLLPGIHCDLKDIKNCTVISAVLKLIILCSITLFTVILILYFVTICYGRFSVVFIGISFFFAVGLSRTLSTLAGVTNIDRKITSLLLVAEILKPGLLIVFIIYIKMSNLGLSDPLFQHKISYSMMLLSPAISSFSSAIISSMIIANLDDHTQSSFKETLKVLSDHFSDNFNTTVSSLFSLLPGFIIVTWSTRTAFESQSTALQFSQYSLLPVSLYIERSALELQRKLPQQLNLQYLNHKLIQYFRSKAFPVLLVGQLFSLVIFLIASRFDYQLNNYNSFFTMSIFGIISVTYLARNLILVLERIKRVSAVNYMQTFLFILLLLLSIFFFRKPTSIQYAVAVVMSSLFSYVLSILFYANRSKIKNLARSF